MERIVCCVRCVYIYLVRSEIFDRTGESNAATGRHGDIVDDIGEFRLVLDDCNET